MKPGWTWLLNSRKLHYFAENGVSLCNRFMVLGNPRVLDDIENNNEFKCKMCQKIRLKQIPK